MLKSKIGDYIAELGDGDHADDEPTELSELSGIGDVDGLPVYACGMGNLIGGQPDWISEKYQVVRGSIHDQAAVFPGCRSRSSALGEQISAVLSAGSDTRIPAAPVGPFADDPQESSRAEE